MSNGFTYKFPRPQLTVDAVVLVWNACIRSWMVLLIRRGKEPYKGLWAFPGGFFDMGDTSVEAAASRELQEETGVVVPPAHLRQFGVFSAADRDPRERVISIAHVAILDDGIPECRGADDAIEARWFPIHEVRYDMLAFDHGQIFTRALAELP